MSQSSAMTPDRHTVVTFDVPETVLLAGPYSSWRNGREIGTLSTSNAGAGQQYAANMRFWSTGCWTLNPIQDRPADLATRTENQPLIVTASPAAPSPSPGIGSPPPLTIPEIPTPAGVAPLITAAPSFRPADITDLVPPAPVFAAQGDPMLTRTFPGNSAAGGILSGTPSPPVDTIGAIVDLEIALIENALHPVPRLLESASVYPADQPWFLRWKVPGSDLPDVVWRFFFGQYCLVIEGSGLASIREYCRPAGIGDRVWRTRDSFRYARTSQVLNTEHTMIIFPHRSPDGGKFIAFAGNHLDASTAGGGVLGSGFGQWSSPTEYAFKADPYIRRGDQDEAPGHVTSSAPIRVDIRQDLKLRFQVSLLRWKAAGALTDAPHAAMLFTYPNPWQVQLRAEIPGATSITAQVFDATNTQIGPDLVFTKTGEKRQETPSTTSASAFVRFIFKNPLVPGTDPAISQDTPILWAYGMSRPEVLAENAPGELDSGGFSHVSLTDATDAASEGGTLEIHDDHGRLTRLANRGELTVRVDVRPLAYSGDADRDARTVPLFRGYVVRPSRSRWGRYDPQSLRDGNPLPPRSGFGGTYGTDATNPRRSYPSPEASNYDLPLLSMFRRLNERANWTFFKDAFVDDPAAPRDPDNPAGLVPWKATDAIRAMIHAAGFPLSQIAIADNPIRLWHGGESTTNFQQIEPGASFGDRALAIARNFLGGWLHWDESIGTGGAWTILYAPNPLAEPVYHFQTYAGRADAPAHLPQGYPANTTFVEGIASEYTIPPEGNHVWVLCAVQLQGNSVVRFENHVYNFKSYRVPGSTNTLDPLHPDYIGREKLVFAPDPWLFAGESEQDGHARTQHAIDYTCRRIFDFACHAQKCYQFQAPLVFIIDPVTMKPRRLRHQDPVTLNGQAAYIRSCEPDYEHDERQWARYEIVKKVT